MALGLMAVLFIGTLLISIITIIITLFAKNPVISKVGFIGTLILSGFTMYASVTSLPTNYITQQLVGLLPGIPCLIAIFMNFKSSGNTVSMSARIIACLGLATSVLCMFYL